MVDLDAKIAMGAHMCERAIVLNIRRLVPVTKHLIRYSGLTNLSNIIFHRSLFVKLKGSKTMQGPSYAAEGKLTTWNDILEIMGIDTDVGEEAAMPFVTQGFDFEVQRKVMEATFSSKFDLQKYNSFRSTLLMKIKCLEDALFEAVKTLFQE